MHWLVLPTLNEAEALEKLLPQAVRLFDRVLVIDGGSTDCTHSIASTYNVLLLTQRGRGKGSAIRQALMLLKDRGSVIYISDADCTADLAEVRAFGDRVGEGTICIGNRFEQGRPAIIDPFSYFINKLVSVVVSIKTGNRFHDVQSPVWIYSSHAVKKTWDKLKAQFFDIEIDMAMQAWFQRIPIHQPGIKIHPRLGSTKFTRRHRVMQVRRVISQLRRRRSE